MSLLSYTGIGSIVLTVSALVKAGWEVVLPDRDGSGLNSAGAPFMAGSSNGERAVPHGAICCSDNGNSDHPCT